MAINEERGMYKETWVSLTHQSLEGSTQGAGGRRKGQRDVGLHSERIGEQEEALAAIRQGLGETTAPILGTVWLSVSEGGCSCSRGSPEKVYQTDPWDGGNEERLRGFGLYSLEIRRVRGAISSKSIKFEQDQTRGRCQKDDPGGGGVQNQGSQSEDTGETV